MRAAACFAFTAAAAGCGEARAAQLAHTQKNARVSLRGGTETELLGARSEAEEPPEKSSLPPQEGGFSCRNPPQHNPGNLETLSQG